MAQLPNFVAIDTESNGLNVWRGARCFAAAAAWPNGQTRYWRGDFAGLRELCADPTIDKVFHNAKHDLRHLEWAGIPVKGKVWDTTIFCHLLDGRNAQVGMRLEDMAIKYLPSDKRKVVTEIDDWFDKNKYGKNQRYELFHELPPPLLEKRCVGDTEITRDIFMRVFSTVGTVFPFLLEQEHRLIPIFKRMEDRGILIDYEEIEKQKKYFDGIIEEVTFWCEEFLGREGVNFNSAADQQEILSQAGCLAHIKAFTKGGKDGLNKRPKMDDYNLRALRHPAAYMILLGKMAVSFRGKFLTQMEDAAVNGVLHANFRQLGTVTGRISCSDPNLLNIPTEGVQGGRSSYTEEQRQEFADMTGHTVSPHLKRIFKCRQGYAHVHSDKRQAEMYMLGHYANDNNMYKVFNHCIDTNGSIHEEICKAVYGEATKGLVTRTKAIIFGYLYGAGLPKMAQTMMGTVAEAATIKAKLGTIFPGLPRWNAQLKRLVQAQGYITTEHGRRHYLAPNEDYIAVNYMCQGSVGDEVKSRMIAIDDYLRSNNIDGTILLNIYDDIGTELPAHNVQKHAPHIKRIMEETSIPFRLRLPASLEVTTTSWADLKKVKL